MPFQGYTNERKKKKIGFYRAPKTYTRMCTLILCVQSLPCTTHVRMYNVRTNVGQR